MTKVHCILRIDNFLSRSVFGSKKKYDCFSNPTRILKVVLFKKFQTLKKVNLFAELLASIQ